MKKIFVLPVLVMMFVLVGCGSAQEEATQAPAETTAAAEATAAPVETTAAPAQTQATAAGDIGVEKAKEIALKDAGVNEADVKFIKQNPDIDDGVSIYEIDFVSGEMEYEYDIEAATGTIRERSSESIYDD